MLKENPSVFFLQETHLQRPGRIKTPSAKRYAWYELHRTIKSSKGEKGGGIAIGVLNVLQPSWISEGDDTIEILVVEVKLSQFNARCICAYGPQESDKLERKRAILE